MRRKAANLRQRREQNEGRGDTDQVGSSHSPATDVIGLNQACQAGQEDSPATIDNNDSINEADKSEYEMSDCIQKPNSDDLTNAALAAGRCGLSSRAASAVIKK